jgi:hypothetical protein
MAAKAPMLVPKGAFMMNILTEGSRPDNRANRAQLDMWITRATAPFTVTLDSVAPQPFLEDFFSLQRDSYLIIDLSTMKIVDVYEQDVDAALAKLESLLQ